MTDMGPATGPLSIEPVWLNEPRRWRWSGGELSLTSVPGAQFWRHTGRGVVRDSGHFLGTRMSGEFIASVEVQAESLADGDQTGLMVRLDAERWIRCGWEYVDGTNRIGCVVTHAVSDWSTTTLPEPPEWLGLRLTRRNDSLSVEFALQPQAWQLHRLAYLPAEFRAYVGPMAVSPDGPGLDVRFRNWSIRPI
jgi:regulation of enolase protein 1 (concanavalin A-like superfamily)